MPLITESKLLGLFPNAERYAPHLLPKMAAAGIDTQVRQAHFLAQIAVESAAFRRVRESLNYSIEGLLDVFGTGRIGESDAERYGRIPSRPANQQAIADLVYGGEWGRRNLGNTEPGDGWRFIGRGLKQVTGRSNYTRCDAALKMRGRLLVTPELLERADLAVDSAIWFWSENNLNSVADTDNVEAVTRIVNGGTNGLKERREWLAKVQAVLR